jgi:hypothetical protein
MRKAIDGLGRGNNKKEKKKQKATKNPSLPPSTVPDWKE